MLLFWICAALLTVAVVVALTRPLVIGAPNGSTADTDADVAVYRDQLTEIEADKARGLINASEAESARIEIARRLLATAGPRKPDLTSEGANGPVSAGRPGERPFMLIAAAVPAVALAFYLSAGSPGLPSEPHAARMAATPAIGADIQELTARVEERLRANPGEGMGWDVIAPVYLRTERFRDAADAFERAIAILGETPRRLAGLAESTVLANDGIVTETARKAYARLIELDPKLIEAHFGLALAMEQDGEIKKAKAAYRALLAQAPADAAWRPYVEERMTALDAKQGPRGNTPAQPSTASTAAPDPLSQIPDDQRQTILQMVEGLATRLKSDGRDVDGWQRLLRSWSVLGERDKAQAALGEAQKALAGDDKALGALNAFASQLGLKS